MNDIRITRDIIRMRKNYLLVRVEFLLMEIISINKFSKIENKGTITIKWLKYNTVDIWPSSIKGLSTCLAPKIIKIMKLATKIQKAIWLKGRKISPLSLPRSV